MENRQLHIDAIITSLKQELSPNELKTIASSTTRDLHSFHNFLGRHIRNEYKLWFTHPLTENWRLNPDSRNIVNGVDHSKDHPDEISMEIIFALHENLKSEFKE